MKALSRENAEKRRTRQEKRAISRRHWLFESPFPPVSDRGFNEDKTATIKAQRGDTRNALRDEEG
jgi:hypothetical protein